MVDLKLIYCCALWYSISLAATVRGPTADHGTDVSDNGEIKFVPLSTSTKLKNDPKEPKKHIEDAKFWRKVGMDQLEKNIKFANKLEDSTYKRKAKNIIIFVGDGMGMTTVTAGRIFKGQYLKHGFGEEEKLVFDEFPYTGISKTYAVDMQVADSAATATAMFTGVKTDYGVVGLDTTRNATNATQGSLPSIFDWAQAEGKRTGLVTTTRITHATPACTYAHSFNRYWESDAFVPPEYQGIYADIASQLIDNAPGKKLNVIMGGGLGAMGALNHSEVKTVNYEYPESFYIRNDNRNLPQEWLENSKDKDDGRRVLLKTREELLNLNVEKVDRVMGLFRNNHLTYSITREEGEPSLKEMTETAIRVLERGSNSNGYVLVVEGGLIDMAHHQNLARASLREVLELDMAIEAALELTNQDETLIIVTADHSHAVTLNGYPRRGDDILGLANKPTDPIKYETITYANGPGYWSHLANDTTNSMKLWRPMEEFTKEQRESPRYQHQATNGLKSETHGGEDVIVYAIGPGASLVRGAFEQNYIAYVMSYVGCIGPAKDIDDSCKIFKSSASVNSISIILLGVVFIF